MKLTKQEKKIAVDVGKQIADEYQLGYAGLGDQVIAELITKGAKRALKKIKREV